MNNFKYSFDNKRYHTYNYHLKTKYGTKVAKISLNASFTCPNRDGRKAYGGCIFCSASGSGDFAGDISDDLIIQFEKGKKIMAKKWPNSKYIAYLQANTNTYGPVEKVKAACEPFVNKEDVVGIALTTRPDCLEDNVLTYLADLNKKTDLIVELGIQTIHQKTSDLINRGHSYQEFIAAVKKLRHHKIAVVVHLINSLPFETTDMMIETAKEIGKLDIQGLKIHMLYVIKHTVLAQMYKRKEFELLTRQEYIETVVQQLRYIPDHIYIERLTGDGNPQDLIAPLWSIKKVTILNDIDKLMAQKNIYQGDLVNK